MDEPAGPAVGVAGWRGDSHGFAGRNPVMASPLLKSPMPSRLGRPSRLSPEVRNRDVSKLRPTGTPPHRPSGIGNAEVPDAA